MLLKDIFFCRKYNSPIVMIISTKKFGIKTFCSSSWNATAWFSMLVHMYLFATYLCQTEAGLHADLIEALLLLQDVRQSQSGGGSWKLFQC